MATISQNTFLFLLVLLREVTLFARAADGRVSFLSGGNSAISACTLPSNIDKKPPAWYQEGCSFDCNLPFQD